MLKRILSLQKIVDFQLLQWHVTDMLNGMFLLSVSLH